MGLARSGVVNKHSMSEYLTERKGSAKGNLGAAAVEQSNNVMAGLDPARHDDERSAGKTQIDFYMTPLTQRLGGKARI